MQLQTQQVTIGKKGECIVSQITLDEDKNLPENKGDIDEIVVSNGKICVEQTEIRDSKILIKGKLSIMMTGVCQPRQRLIRCLANKKKKESQLFR